LYREVEIGWTFLGRRGAMRKIGGVLRDGIFERPVSDGTPYVIFEITKDSYQNGGRALVG
jgi:hypothetical protein